MKVEYQKRTKFLYNRQIHGSIITHMGSVGFFFYDGFMPSNVSSCGDFRSRNALREDLRLRDKGEMGVQLLL